MGALTAKTVVAYYAPTKRKRYLTRMGAAKAEAAAMILRKYPSERADYDEFGRCEYPGFYWRQDDRLVQVWSRLARRIAKQAKP